MKIEIAEQGRMTQTGSSLLKLIQNNNMPAIDLLVRESIQNSLDARRQDVKYVDVEYLTGIFSSHALSNELEGITRGLNKRYPEDQYSYIAISDSNTVGLTGETDPKAVKNNDYGNLLKLVYEVCKPQEAEGAGGSWGLGKTVYFRIGIGLVIYYSRIKKSSGHYESRLAATLVENETAKDSLIPVYENQAKRGIAWWGEKTGKNITAPVTDEKYINSFLNIFGLKPYDDEKTGTVIIIPFIDKQKLLSNNQVEYIDSSDNRIIPFWCSELDDYISIAAQRWYAPRLNNVHYNHGAFLRMKINGKGIGLDAMEPVFQVIQALYNRANYIKEDDILSGMDDQTFVEPIRVNKFLSDPKIGLLAYTKVPREVLGMEVPRNKPEPYIYFNCEIRNSNLNAPVICYTRKPAMIVSYENTGAWAGNISSCSKSEYILGVFVLNTGVQLKNGPDNMSLEEYVRRSEMADHASWNDWSEGTYNPRLITKIQNSVNRIVDSKYSPEDQETQPRAKSGLGRLMGDLLLPPEGFGKGSSIPPSPHPPKPDSKSKGIVFKADASKTKFAGGKLIIPFDLRTSKKRISSVEMEMNIDSESSTISVPEWETQMSLGAPFNIEDLRAQIEYLDEKNVQVTVEIPESELYSETHGVRITKIVTSSNTCYGFRVQTDTPKTIKMRVFATIHLNRKDVKPSFSYKKEG